MPSLRLSGLCPAPASKYPRRPHATRRRPRSPPSLTGPGPCLTIRLRLLDLQKQNSEISSLALVNSIANLPQGHLLSLFGFINTPVLLFSVPHPLRAIVGVVSGARPQPPPSPAGPWSSSPQTPTPSWTAWVSAYNRLPPTLIGKPPFKAEDWIHLHSSFSPSRATPPLLVLWPVAPPSFGLRATPSSTHRFQNPVGMVSLLTSYGTSSSYRPTRWGHVVVGQGQHGLR